ncbi:LON-domain-containing protein, partial [Backusella circina FSU 941]
ILTQVSTCPSCSGKLERPYTFPCGYTVCQPCVSKTCRHCQRLHTAPIHPNVTLQSIQVIVHSHPPNLAAALSSVTECPICCTRFTLPTTTLCGHVFCNNCLVRSLDHQRFCPFCRDPLEFVPNPTLLLNHVITDMFEQDEESADALQNDNRVPLIIGSLAFPHVKCVIHIFEPRYRLMLRRIMESGRRRFAMCLARRKKSETEDPFHEYGTILEINQIQTLQDGRSIVEAVGSHRFRVTNYELVDGYHMAEIERVDDVDREQENILEQQQILRASATRARQQQQPLTMQAPQIQPPIVPQRPPIRPPSITRAPMSASVRPMTSRPTVTPVGMGQRRSWAQQAHPQTAQVNRAPWLQMHVRGLSAARPKKGPSSSETPTPNVAQPKPPQKSREELGTEELLDEIVCHIEKLLQQSSEWTNAMGEPPALRQGRDRVILTWWIGNIIPLSEEERVTLLMMRTCRQRVQQILTWIDKFKDQWSLFLNKPNMNCAIM